MKKIVLFALASSFLAAAATAQPPSNEWRFCKQFLNPPICKIFR